MLCLKAERHALGSTLDPLNLVFHPLTSTQGPLGPGRRGQPRRARRDG